MHERPKVVDDEFAARYGDGKQLDRVDRMQKRNEVAKDLVTTTYKEMQSELKERAKETHEREVKEWELGLDGVAEAEDVDGYASPRIFEPSPTDVTL